MKNKSLLMLLAIGGLLLSPHSSYATTKTNPEITNLSQTISELVNLAPDNQLLVAAAIHRALIAKELTSNQKPTNIQVQHTPNILQTNPTSSPGNRASGRSDSKTEQPQQSENQLAGMTAPVSRQRR
jgi:hypothetical protein